MGLSGFCSQGSLSADSGLLEDGLGYALLLTVAQVGNLKVNQRKARTKLDQNGSIEKKCEN